MKMKTLTEIRYVQLPDAPPIYGLVFRGFLGESDFPKMASVMQSCRNVDQIERVDCAVDIARRYRHLVKSDPYKDMLFAELNGQVIGYGRVSWREELDKIRIYEQFGYVLPEWRGRGIGKAMLHYHQRRLLKIAAGHPKKAVRFYESWTADTETAASALFLYDGYTVVRYFYEMVRPDLDDIPEAPMPSNLEVRPVLPEHYQAIYDASLEAFRDHWGYSEDQEQTIEEYLEDPNFDPTLWRVAWDGSEVVGMVRSFINPKENAEYNRKRGWTEEICVRRQWRRRGLARSLLVQSLHAVKERGMKEAGLGVDTQNPSGALHLYESVGFKSMRRWSTFHKKF
jgi:ribosomal protein S18 acetylase RimI-like enzyme